MAERPSVAWDETNPAGSQARSLGDNRIREMKTQFREIFEEDHVIESSGQDTDWGWHKKTQFQEQASDPANAANTVILYAKEEGVNNKAALYFQDEDGNVVQLTEGSNFIAGISGEIRMWSGTIATIPTGWILCNGSSGTPDLRNRFIVAANADDGGVAKTTITGSALASGGSATHTHVIDSVTGSHVLTTDEMPAHTHSVTYRDNADGGASIPCQTGGSGTETAYATTSAGGGSGHTHTLSGASSASAATDIPPFYALAFMQKS